MFVRLGRLLVVVALVGLIGTQWALLQTIAWTAMLANNLRTQSLTASVTHAFDGKHPCCLCKAIAAGKKSEKKNPSAPPSQKWEFPLVNVKFALFGPSHFELLPRANFFAEFRSLKPLLPPPRSSFV